MATDISTTLHVKGTDSLSGVLDKVNGNLAKTGKHAKDAASGTDAIGERAGNMERGFMGLKDVIGGIAEGPLASVADRMGGIEAIIKGFGPGMGAVGLAIGAAAMGASLLYERMEKARKAALDVEIQRLDTIKEDGEALARHLSLSQELLGVKTGIGTVESVSAAAMGRAKELLENQKAILEAQKEKQDEKIALLQIEGATLRGLLGVDELRLARAKEAAEIASGRAVKDIQNARWRESEDARVNAIMNVKDRLNERARVRDNERANLQVRIATTVADLETASGKKAEELEIRFTEQKRRQIALAAQERADAAEGENFANTRAAARNAAAQRAHSAQMAMEQKRQAAEKEHEQWMRENFAQRRDDLIQREVDLVAAQDRVRAAEIAAAESPAATARLALLDTEIRAMRERELLEVQFAGDGEMRELRALEIDQRVAAEKRRINADLSKASEDARKKSEAESNQKISDALAIGGAVVDGLKQADIGKRASAALDFTLAGAQALYQGAIGNIPGAIAAGFAAAKFASVALGAGGGEGASSPAVGGGMTSATASGGGSQPSGGGGAVVINFTKGFYGDAHSTAKSITDTMKSIKGTGYAAWKGA